MGIPKNVGKKRQMEYFFLTNDISHQQCYHHSCHTERRGTLILSAKKYVSSRFTAAGKEEEDDDKSDCMLLWHSKKDTWTTEIFWHLISVYCVSVEYIIWSVCTQSRGEWQSKSKKKWETER